MRGVKPTFTIHERNRIPTKFLKLKCKVKTITDNNMKTEPKMRLGPEQSQKRKRTHVTSGWKININLKLEGKKIAEVHLCFPISESVYKPDAADLAPCGSAQGMIIEKPT